MDDRTGPDALDDADVLVPHDQIAGTRRLAGGQRSTRLLCPAPQGVDGSLALPVGSDGRARLPCDPGDEKRAPRPDARAAGRGSVLRDPRGVVAAEWRLALADLAGGELDD